MNPSPATQPRYTLRLIPDNNPWENGKSPERPAPQFTWILSLLCPAFAVAPCFLFRWPEYTLFPLILCIAYLLLAARAPMAWLSSAGVFAVAHTASQIFGGRDDVALTYATAALCVLCAVSIGALLIAAVRSYWLFLIPAASLILALLITEEITPAVCTLLLFPVAGGLAFATMRNQPRVTVICVTSVLVCFFGLFAGALFWYRAFGKISADAVFNAISAIRDELIQSILDNAETAQWTSVFNGNAEQMTTLLTTLVDQAVVLLPAMIVFAANLFSYAAQLICNRSFVGIRLPQLVTYTSRIFCMSTVSAVIYLLCTLITMFSAEVTLATAVMENLLLMIFPGMVIVGAWRLIANLRAHRSGLFAILLVVGFFLVPSVALLVLSVSGAFTTLFRPLALRFMTNPPPSSSPPGSSGTPDSPGNDAESTGYSDDNDSSDDDFPGDQK